MGRRKVAQVKFEHMATETDKKQIAKNLKSSEFTVEHRNGKINVFKES